MNEKKLIVITALKNIADDIKKDKRLSVVEKGVLLMALGNAVKGIESASDEDFESQLSDFQKTLANIKAILENMDKYETEEAFKSALKEKGVSEEYIARYAGAIYALRPKLIAKRDAIISFIDQFLKI